MPTPRNGLRPSCTPFNRMGPSSNTPPIAPVEPAPKDGVLPDAFYATSHLRTQIRLNHHWLDVEPIEMDVAIRVTPDPPIGSHRPHGRSESR